MVGYVKMIAGLVVLVFVLAAVNRYVFHVPVIGAVLDKIWSKGGEVSSRVKDKVDEARRPGDAPAPAEPTE